MLPSEVRWRAGTLGREDAGAAEEPVARHERRYSRRVGTNATIKLYEPVPAEGYEWAVPDRDADFDVLRQFDGTSRRACWSPIRVTLGAADDNSGSPLEGDFPWLGSHVLVMRERAIAAVGDLFNQHGELLPLECDEAALWLLNVCRSIDALDEEASEIVRFSSGRIMVVRKPVFRSDALGDADIFKVPQLLTGPIYFTDKAVDQMEAAQLTGLTFKLVFEEW